MIRRTLADLLTARAVAERPYIEFLRSDSMSAGLYVLAAGATDEQSPHGEDEVYVVLGGRSSFTAGNQSVDVVPGDTLYVPAGMPHRFHEIAEELVLAVVFAPPET